MALHRLASITIGVPNVEETSRYYAEFGLTRDGACFSTRDGGEQLRIVESPTRRLIELGIGADDPDDLDRVADRLTRLGVSSQRDESLRVGGHGAQRSRVLRQGGETGIHRQLPEGRVLDHQLEGVGLHQHRHGVVAKLDVGVLNLAGAIALSRRDCAGDAARELGLRRRPKQGGRSHNVPNRKERQGGPASY